MYAIVISVTPKTLNTCVLLDLVVIVGFSVKLLLVIRDIVSDPGVVL